MNSQKSIKLSILLTNLFILLLIIIVIALPFMVSWYVEVRGRSASLPATIMVTCYPCAPFVGAMLLSIRKMLKNVLLQQGFFADNSIYLKRICVYALIISIITLVAGKYYMPFFIVGGTFTFLSLLTFSLMNVLKYAVPQNEICENNTDNKE